MSNTSEQKQPLEDSKEEQYENGEIAIVKKEGTHDFKIGENIKIIQLDKSAVVSGYAGYPIYFAHSLNDINNKWWVAEPQIKKAKSTPDSKEGLHTQAEAALISLLNILDGGLDVTVKSKSQAHADFETLKNERKALVNDLGDAVNQIEDLKDILEQTEFSKKKLEDERKALLDSHRELIEKLTMAKSAYFHLKMELNPKWDYAKDVYYQEFLTAINNAKNI